jgi:hypothetical protein
MGTKIVSLFKNLKAKCDCNMQCANAQSHVFRGFVNIYIGPGKNIRGSLKKVNLQNIYTDRDQYMH